MSVRGVLDRIYVFSFWSVRVRVRVCRIHMAVVGNLGICVDAGKMMRRKWANAFVAYCCLDLDWSWKRWSCLDDDWHWP